MHSTPFSKSMTFGLAKRNIYFLKPLPDMPNSGSSNSAANKEMMSKIWTNGDSYLIELKTFW